MCCPTSVTIEHKSVHLETNTKRVFPWFTRARYPNLTETFNIQFVYEGQKGSKLLFVAPNLITCFRGRTVFHAQTSILNKNNMNASTFGRNLHRWGTVCGLKCCLVWYWRWASACISHYKKMFNYTSSIWHFNKTINLYTEITEEVRRVVHGGKASSSMTLLRSQAPSSGEFGAHLSA